MIGAVDIGGTKIAVGMVTESGQVLARKESPTDAASYANGLATIAGLLRETAQIARVETTGIGIGSTGPVDPFTGKFGEVDFLPGWRGQNPVEDLARIFHVQVALENDADAAALAEAGWGAGKNKSRLIYVTVGTGIGGGIVFDGHLYRGVGGAHPELGHQVIDPAGPLCSCGFRGCWESLAAGPAMVAFSSSRLRTVRYLLRSTGVLRAASARAAARAWGVRTTFDLSDLSVPLATLDALPLPLAGEGAS